MNEHGFIKAVHRHLPEEVYRWKIHDTYTGGVPDAFYCGPAGSLWAEYKYIKLPKRPTTSVAFGLSTLQLLWLTRMEKNGQLPVLIVGWDKLACLIPAKDLVKPQFYRHDLEKCSMSFIEMAAVITKICVSGGYRDE